MFKFTNTHDKLECCAKAVRTLFTGHMRLSSPNYYEMLNLRKDCSTKDIRNAYIKLSKEMHPDKNHNDPKTHQKFVKLNEAYSILSRPRKRNAYDISLGNIQQVQRSKSSNNGGMYSTTYTDPSIHYGFWRPENSHRTEDMKGKINLSKSWIVILCILFTSIGVGLQVLAIRKSITFSRDKLHKASEEHGRLLAELKHQAKQNTFHMQLQIMEQKIEDSVDQYKQSRGSDK